MSPNYALALLLLCLVLLGLSNAQPGNQGQNQPRYRSGGQRVRPRNLGGGCPPIDINGEQIPVGAGGGSDCGQNNLASNIKDNRRRH